MLGSDLTAEEEPKVQKYIDIVSSFIESTTGIKFSLLEDQVVKAVSDGKGIIEIEDLSEVSLVELLEPYDGVWSDIASPIYYAFNSGSYGYTDYYVGWGFDGISKIYGLRPKRTYRVTCSYGRTPDEDIKGVVAQLVLAGTGLDTTAVNGLKTYRVGDVEETYGVVIGGGAPVVTLSSLMTQVLDSYSTGNTTYRL